MKASDLTPSKYLRQSDVEPAKLVTITGVEKVKFDQGGESKVKWAMSFRELDKPLLLNKTNINRTVKAVGTDDVEDWVGRKIVLYFDPDVEFGGDIVGGIRIRAPKNASAMAETEPEVPSRRQHISSDAAMQDDDIPF